MTLPPFMMEESLIWDDQGHLAEPAVTALADGELSLVSPAAISHADECPACADRVGRAALLALDLSQALTQLSSVPEPSAASLPSARAARRPLPLPLLAAALLVAALGSLPGLARLGGLWRVPSLLVHSLPALVRASSLVLHSPSGGRMLAIAGAASAALLLVMGITIARRDLRLPGQPLEKGAR